MSVGLRSGSRGCRVFVTGGRAARAGDVGQGEGERLILGAPSTFQACPDYRLTFGILLLVVGLSAVGLVLLLLPRFNPHVPRWAESVVPPRYRRRRRAAAEQLAQRERAEQENGVGAEAGLAHGPQEMTDGCPAVPTGVNGATAIGARSRNSSHV